MLNILDGKRCQDCDHCVMWSYGSFDNDGLCRRFVDEIEGSGQDIACSKARDDEQLCGSEGKFWQKKMYCDDA